MTSSQNSNVAWRNPWFLGWMGLLVFVLIVNFSMVYLAITNNSRLLTKDFYEKGKAYSDNRLKLEATRLAWQGTLEQPDPIKLNQANYFHYTLINKVKETAEPERVIFYAYRPSDGSFDFQRPMKKIKKGQYELSIQFPLKGIWDVMISAQQGEKEHNTALTLIVRE